MGTLVAPAINLGLLILLLAYYLKQPLRDFVLSRHITLKTELDEVRKKLFSAQEKYDEFSAKLKVVDVEVAALKNQVRQDAKSTYEKVVADARRLSTTIITDARASAESSFSDLKSQLRSELALRVIDRAEGLLRERLTGEDHVRIRREFSAQVEKQ